MLKNALIHKKHDKIIKKGIIMKYTLLLLILILLVTTTTQATMKKINSNEIISPLFSSKDSNENKIWVCTFQLVFNDIKNNIIKNNIEFKDEKPTEELTGLNKEEFNSSMLNKSSYYTSYGKTTLSEKEKIKKDIKEKFNETSDIIDTLDWSEEKGKFYAYAMLKKEFEFINAFDKLSSSKFNNSQKEYAFFGINNNSNQILRKNINILFYNNENDYAVSLNTMNDDIIILYRNDKNDSLQNLYQEMREKENNYTNNKFLNKSDTLKIPNLKFKKVRKYQELCNKLIKGTDYMFSDAIETVQFELDNKGGKVKSEAVAMIKLTSAAPNRNIKPRHFNFDKTFNMFLIDSGKTEPYMGLRIYDLDKFSPYL